MKSLDKIAHVSRLLSFHLNLCLQVSSADNPLANSLEPDQAQQYAWPFLDAHCFTL